MTPGRRTGAGWAALWLVLLACAGVSQAGEGLGFKDLPTAADELPHPPGWLQPCGQVQLEMDSELVPVGRGAVFVPAMSESAAEPSYIVLDEKDDVVERRPAGRRAILVPGRYIVLVGSGVEGQMTPHRVEVFEGHTTLVEPNWAGLLVRVVDQHGTQFRGAYEVFALPGGEDFGLGLGADETAGETLRTWLLPPGRYLLVRSGETPRARTDFLTVRLEAGELVHLTLVLDDKDGHFLGGGVIDRWEGKTEIEGWRLGLIVGGDVLWNRNDHIPGREFGNSLSFNLFVDGLLRYLDPNHMVYGRLQIDEGGQILQTGGTSVADMDWRKTIDEVDFDAIYTYRLLSWLGPYVRFGLNTNLLPGYRYFDTRDRDVVILDSDLEQVERRVRPSELELAASVDPLELKEGLGVSFDLSPSLVLDLHLRVGLGSRQTVVRSLLIERESEEPAPLCTDAMCFTQAASNSLLGAEATLIGSARLSRWLMIDTELDSLVPFGSWVAGEQEENLEPVFNWKTTVSLRLVSFASLAYVVKLDYNKQLSDYLQFEQRLLLRFTFDIL